ncbi:hypothetical protein GCM10011316_11700 [Roseibium aquae]|uniref:Uncharacterized protein n=1 Tax=Roseibium aquae TaxID=1323746 RepID=A0A916WZE2_9HYPH|nr:hypothetical protein GCM10011316_11700 [Roseibium aquae]
MVIPPGVSKIWSAKAGMALFLSLLRPPAGRSATNTKAARSSAAAFGCSDPDWHHKGSAAYVAPRHHQMLVKIMFMRLA